MNKVLIIGCGHMGSALLSSWIDLESYSYLGLNNNFWNSVYKIEK